MNFPKFKIFAGALTLIPLLLLARQRVIRGAVRLPTLAVLCAEDWLDPEAVSNFARDHSLKIDLFTYDEPAELVRQLANAEGRVDVICASSLLVRSLRRAQWIKAVNFGAIERAREISADFTKLPFDPEFSLGMPLHWLVYGYYSLGRVEGTLKQIMARSRLGVWATPLNYLSLMTQSGLKFEERLESEDFKRVGDDVHRFKSMTVAIPPASWGAGREGLLKRFEIAFVPSVVVPSGTGFFTPAEDGGIVDVGLLAIGERAPHPELAMKFINNFIRDDLATDHAIRTRRGSVHRSSEGERRLSAAQRPSSLRLVPLTKMRFPDVDAEAVLRFSPVLKGATGE